MVSSALGAVVDLAAAHHGVVSRAQAARSGLSPGQIHRLIRRGVFHEPAPGVLVVRGAPASFARHVQAAALLAPAGICAGLTSGWIHQVDGIAKPTVVGLELPRGSRPNTGSLPIAIATSRAMVAPDDVIERAGVRVWSVARTVVGLAAHPLAPPLGRLVDDYERRGLSLTWLEQTAVRLRRRGRAGPTASGRTTARRS